jgi:hypothetical protein
MTAKMFFFWYSCNSTERCSRSSSILDSGLKVLEKGFDKAGENVGLSAAVVGAGVFLFLGFGAVKTSFELDGLEFGDLGFGGLGFELDKKSLGSSLAAVFRIELFASYTLAAD